MTTPPLPYWPAMLSIEMCGAYTGLGVTSFRQFAFEHRLFPVDTGRRRLLYRRADIDRVLDSLPVAGPSSDAVNTDAPPPPPVVEDAEAALAAAERRLAAGRR